MFEIGLVEITFTFTGWLGGTTGSASDQQSINDRKVAGSRPTKVVCITVLTGNRMG